MAGGSDGAQAASGGDVEAPTGVVSPAAPPSAPVTSAADGVPTAAVKARVAVAVLFTCNALVNAFFPRLAEIQRDLGLTAAELGTAMGFGSVGGLIGGPLAGVLMRKAGGSGKLAVGFSIIQFMATPLVGLAKNGVAFAAALMLIGAADAVMDAAMNAHGMRVQALYGGRSIINSFHGFWSLSMVLGGIIGVATAAAEISVLVTLTVLSAVCIVSVLLATLWLLPGPDPDSLLHDGGDDRDAAAAGQSDAGGAATPAVSSVSAEPRRCDSVRRPILWALGAFIMGAVVVELLPTQWSAVYMSSLGVSVEAEGTAYVVFQIAMTAGRFAGDRIVDRLTDVVWTRVAMGLTTGAMSVALFVETPLAFCIACGVSGVATATLFPSALRAAAHLPGVDPGVGVSIVSWLSRAGFFLAPLIVGGVAATYGLSWGLSLLPVSSALLVLVSGVLKAQGTPKAGLAAAAIPASRDREELAQRTPVPAV